MLQYLKLFIISIVSSIFISLPASSGGVYAYFSNVLRLSSDSDAISFYYSVILITFSLISLFLLRRLMGKGISVLKSSQSSKNEKASYRNMFISMLISAAFGLVALVPYSKGKTLSSLFDSFLSSKDMLVLSASAVFCGFVGLVAVIFNRHHGNPLRRSANIKDVVQLSIYSILSTVFPGFSRFSVAADSLVISGVNENNVVRDTLMYITPAQLVIGIIKLIDSLKRGFAIDPIMIAVCIISSAIGSIIALNIIKKVKINHLLLFFSIFSVVFGIIAVITAFYLL